MPKPRASEPVLIAFILLALSCPAAFPQSLAIGESARIDPLIKLQGDWRGAVGNSTSAEWDLHLARIGVHGELLKRIEYEVERELTDDSNPWRDVYVDVRVFEAVQARAGKFKVPFSLDILTGAMDLDFIYRSLAASGIAPGRDVGAEVHGRVLHRVVRYDVGLFRSGGDNAELPVSESAGRDGMFAVRVAASPWRNTDKSPVRNLTFGGGVTRGDLPEGLYSLDVRTASDDRLFPRTYVLGTRTRMGGDVEWRHASFGVRAEVIHARDERRGQGTDDDDLPALQSGGVYISGTWVVTGEKKTDRVKPHRSAPRHGIGAVEVAARLERVVMGTAGGGEVSAGPRAANLADRESRVLTLGTNWYLNRYVRVQANVIREHRLDAFESASEEAVTWHPVMRIQFGL